MAGKAIEEMAMASNAAAVVQKEEAVKQTEKMIDLSPLIRDLIAAVTQTTEAVNNLNVGTI